MDCRRTLLKTPRPRYRAAGSALVLSAALAAWAQSAPPLPDPTTYGGTWVFDNQGGIIQDKPVVSTANFTISGDSISGTLSIGDGVDDTGKPVKNALGSEIRIQGTRDPETKTLVAFKFSGNKLKGKESSIRFEGNLNDPKEKTATGYLLYEDGPYLGLQFTLKFGGPSTTTTAPSSAMLLDANPVLMEVATNTLMEPLPFSSENQLREMLPKLLQASEPLRRRGTAADGLSMLLIVQQYSSPGTATFRLPNGQDMGGLLEPVGEKLDFSRWRFGRPYGTATVSIKTVGQGSVHYAAALYMPPHLFDDGFSQGRKILFEQGMLNVSPLAPAGSDPEKTIAARQVDVSIEFRSDAGGGENGTATRTIELVRPPVVLVHGTFDAPYECWDTPWLGGKTMVQRLQEHGFQVWLADYRNTNGLSGRGDSHFEDNKQAVAASPPTLTRQRDAGVAGTDVAKFGPTHAETGGIEYALKGFRNNGFAATQSDVVAHSLGGVLSRVCASEDYNPQYKSPGNFDQGLIRRLITVSTTHFGSDCERPVVKYPGTMQLLNYRTSGEFRLDMFRTMTTWDLVRSEIVPRLVDYTSGTWTGAFEDQTPGSPALKKIKATWVPAHAIACVCEDRDLDGAVLGDIPEGAFEGAPTDEQLAALGLFEDSYRRRLAAAFFLTTDDDFETTLPDFQKPDARRMIQLRASLDADLSQYGGFWKTKNLKAFAGLKTNVRPVEEALKRTIAHVSIVECGKDLQFVKDWAFPRYWELVRMYRAMVFGCCENDCTVRLESSLCGLKPGAPGTTVLRRVLHGYAPSYASVKNRVVELLRGKADQFRSEGFPEAGQDINAFNKLLDNSAEMTQVTVPNLVGKPLSAALDMLWKPPYSDVGFRPAAVIPERTDLAATILREGGVPVTPSVFVDRSRLNGTVTGQDQMENTKVLRNAVIRLTYE